MVDRHPPPYDCALCPVLERSARLAVWARRLAIQAHGKAGHRGTWADCHDESCRTVRALVDPPERSERR